VLAATALLAWLAGAGGLASFVLLAAIVAAAARLLLAVGDAAEGRSDRFPAIVSGAGLACLVAAGALHLPVLAAGLLVCAALDLVASPSARPVAPPRPKPAELADAPVSRAA
jgi:hypothetical protein